MSKCLHCDAPLPAASRIDRRFCDAACRGAHYRAERARAIAAMADELARLRVQHRYGEPTA